MRKGSAGTMESNDAYIEVESSDTLEIMIESIVYDFFVEQIKQTIVDTLQACQLSKVKVTVKDKGALDYTIRARLVTAIKRMEENNA